MSPEEIKQLREKLGLTQEEFADLLGVGFTTVNRWENGKSEPRGQALQTLEKLKELVEEAEESEDISLKELRGLIKDLKSGRLISKFSPVLPGSVLALMATGGLVGFIASLSATMLMKKLKGKEDKKDKENDL